MHLPNAPETDGPSNEMIAFAMDFNRRVEDLNRTRTPALYRETRQACGLTIADLANFLGLSHDTVARRERGRTAIPAEAWMALGQICTTLADPDKLPSYWRETAELAAEANTMND